MSLNPRVRPLLRLVVALLGLLAVVLFAAPWLLRDRLVGAFEAELDRQLDATVRFDSLSVGLIRHFPDVTLDVRGLTVHGEGPFEGVPLLELDELSLTVDLFSLIRGSSLQIERLALVRPNVRILFDEEGRSNLAVFPESDEEVAVDPSDDASWTLALRSYVVEDLDLELEDRSSGMQLRLYDVDHEGSAELHSSGTLRADTRTDVGAIDLLQGEVQLLRKAPLEWDLAFELDPTGTRVELRDNRLRLADLDLLATGGISLADDHTGFDLELSAPGARIENLLSLVPVEWAGSLADLQSQGEVRLGGTVQGHYTDTQWPALDLRLQVADATFGWPDLPSFERVAVDAHIAHPGGEPDLLTLDVPVFSVALGGQPLEGSFRASHPFGDTAIAATLAGQLDLERLGRAVPALDTSASGRVDVDLAFEGRVDDFVEARVDAVRAQGSVQVADLVWHSPENPEPIHLDAARLQVRPEAVELSEARVRIGRSDFVGSGRLENLPAWLLGQGVLTGRAELESRSVDLDALAAWSSDTDPQDAEQASSLFVVPADLDLALGIDMAEVVYGGRTYEEVRGRLAAREGRLLIEDLRLRLFDAQVSLDGAYVAPDEQAADVELRIGVQDLGVPEAMRSFETLELLAPVAARATGRVGTELQVALRLGPDLTPDLTSLLSEGRLQLVGVALQPVVLQQVAQKLGNERFRALDLADSVLRYRVKDGRLQVDPTPLTLGGVQGTLSGSSGVLDRTLDLSLDMVVPTSEIRAPALVSGLVGDRVPVTVQIRGTHDAPRVSVDFGDAVSGALDTLKAEVRQELGKAVQSLVDSPRVQEARQRAEALLAEARTQADALVAEAAQRAEGLRNAARVQADALVAEAKNPLARQAAQKAGEKLVTDADAAAKKVEREARRAADSLVQNARKQGDELMARAREEGGG